jgi:hypothetical protein
LKIEAGGPNSNFSLNPEFLQAREEEEKGEIEIRIRSKRLAGRGGS